MATVFCYAIGLKYSQIQGLFKAFIRNSSIFQGNLQISRTSQGCMDHICYFGQKLLKHVNHVHEKTYSKSKKVGRTSSWVSVDYIRNLYTIHFSIASNIIILMITTVHVQLIYLWIQRNSNVYLITYSALFSSLFCKKLIAQHSGRHLSCFLRTAQMQTHVLLVMFEPTVKILKDLHKVWSAQWWI